MKATIKNYHSPDIEDLNTFLPKEADNFMFYLQLSIGPKDEEGEEIFGITICTPKWLLAKYSKDSTLLLRHYLIVFEYDFQLIKNRIESEIQKANGSNWEEIALKISRIAYWEFEDYQKIKEN